MSCSASAIRAVCLGAAIASLLCVGCQSGVPAGQVASIAMSPVPRELDMVSLPEYRVAPPDILLIEAVNNIRPPELPLRAGDTLVIRATNTLPLDPGVDPTVSPIEYEIGMQFEQAFKVINGPYVVQSNGTVDLGPVYGAVPVEGLTLEQARSVIERYLRERPDNPEERLPEAVVAVTMPDIAGRQAITGEHLVRPDGTVSLGIYGSVYVAGLTLSEVKAAVEQHLSQYVHDPEVSVDVALYASKVVYIIVDGGGAGERVLRLYLQGNETVLDALASEAVQGLAANSSKNIWVARPGPAGSGVAKVMPVDWRAIAEKGITTTNYQLFPGDRIYIQADHMVKFDIFIAKFTAPFERLFGFVILGNGMVRNIQRGRSGFGTGFGGGFN